MKKNKIVYVVMGSEDGILGVYGNVKKAYGVASEYVTGAYEYNGTLKSYSWVLKEFKQVDFMGFDVDVMDHQSNYASASISRHYFNQQ